MDHPKRSKDGIYTVSNTKLHLNNGLHKAKLIKPTYNNKSKKYITTSFTPKGKGTHPNNKYDGYLADEEDDI